MTIVSYFRNVRCSLRQGWLNSSTFILLVDRVNPVWRISGSAVCHIRPGHSQSELITGLQMTRVVGSMISTERTFLLNQHAESAVSQIPHRPGSCTDSVSNHRGTGLWDRAGLGKTAINVQLLSCTSQQIKGEDIATLNVADLLHWRRNSTLRHNRLSTLMFFHKLERI